MTYNTLQVISIVVGTACIFCALFDRRVYKFYRQEIRDLREQLAEERDRNMASSLSEFRAARPVAITALPEAPYQSYVGDPFGLYAEPDDVS